MSNIKLTMNNWHIKDNMPYINLGNSGENNVVNLEIKVDELVEATNDTIVTYFLDIYNKQDEHTARTQLCDVNVNALTLTIPLTRSFLTNDGIKLLQIRCITSDKQYNEISTQLSNKFHAIVGQGNYNTKYDIDNLSYGEQVVISLNSKLKDVVSDVKQMQLGGGLDQQTLTTNIVNAVNEYLEYHPSSVDADKVTRIVNEFFNEHKDELQGNTPVKGEDYFTQEDIVDIISDIVPYMEQHIDDFKGSSGKSAYDIAVENGFVGTELQWLQTLKGDKGDKGDTGINGKSAYELAIAMGYRGNLTSWLESLKGDKGEQGIQGAKGDTGESGKSAYQIAVDNGFSGTESEWLASLKGEKGDSGSGGATSDLSIFCDNIDVDYAYDSATNANYTIIRIYRDKIDGSKQYPFVYAPNGANACEKTSYDVANEDGWLFTINGGVFNTSTHIVDGMLIENGVVLKNTPTEYHSECRPLTIDSDGQLGEADYNADANTLVANGIVSAVCGFMAIIKDFAAVPSSQWNSVAHYTENAQRQIIGQFGNGDYAIITCEGRNFDNSDGWTIEEAQNICIKHGLKFAYNLDGGGSTETMLGLKHFNRIYEGTTGRKVPSFIVFNGKTSFDVILPETEKTLSSITANKTKMSYSVGDSLDIDDVTAIANYSDGTSANVTNSVQINTSGVDMSNSGNYSIVVTYTEDGITKSCNILIQVQSGSDVPSENDYEFLVFYPPLYDNNVLQTNHIVGRAGAWTQTPNDAPAKDKSTGKVIGYLIPIPQDAVGVTVTTTDVITGLSTYNIVDEKPTRLLDAGWGKTVGTNALTFNKGEYEYLAVNCKRSNNFGFDSTTDTSAWKIEFS